VVIGLVILTLWRRGYEPSAGAYLETGKKLSPAKVSTAT